MEEAFKINKKTSRHRNDQAVQGTNDSSILSKISTSELGYFEDDSLKYFATKVVRRSPLVNRGYYIRARLIDFMIKEFLSKTSSTMPNQILNLGAGFDSSFFRLNSQNLLGRTLFIEVINVYTVVLSFLRVNVSDR
jgi:tRNA wybutosine-synthesizing protein 4